MKKEAWVLITQIMLSASGCQRLGYLLNKTTLNQEQEQMKTQQQEYRSFVTEQTGVTVILSDDDVRKLCLWVVATLQDTKVNRAKLPRDIFPPYFADNLGNNDPNTSAFCQQSSLALGETLKAFGIWSKQIHVTNPATGTGIHQFLEYRIGNGERVVIDSFGLLRYRQNGKLLDSAAIIQMSDEQIRNSLEYFGAHQFNPNVYNDNYFTAQWKMILTGGITMEPD